MGVELARTPPTLATPTPKIAIVLPFGLFEYVVMPVMFSYGVQSFQCLMAILFHKLTFVFTYLDYG